MTFVEIDFRARSRFTIKADASAFDPHAEAGAQIEVGTVADWQDAHEHVHAVVDGEYAYGLAPGTNLDKAPRFLPDVMTGGLVVVLVPEKFASLDLRCDFPNAATPNGEVLHPASVVFALEGKRPEAAEREALAEVDDGPFKVSIVSQQIAAEFAGKKAAKGRKLLVIDVTVAASEAEFFQTDKQLHYATEKGEQLGLHAATWSGLRRPERKIPVPAGERRSFQLVFEIPESEKKLRLAYAGYTKAETLDLKADDKAAPEKKRSCPKCKVEAAPNDEYCQECGEKIGK